jgi:hypothetical protein
MKPSLFPQVDTVPAQVKQKIMSYVTSDLQYRRQGIFTRSKLIRTNVPVLLLAILFVGFFSLLFIQRTQSPRMSSLSFDDFQLLEQKL